MSDLISRQAAIDAVESAKTARTPDGEIYVAKLNAEMNIRILPSAQPEIVRCKECRWWDKKDGSPVGYCHAAKHGYYSGHWEIEIYRTYEEDFYCADGEREGEE